MMAHLQRLKPKPRRRSPVLSRARMARGKQRAGRQALTQHNAQNGRRWEHRRWCSPLRGSQSWSRTSRLVFQELELRWRWGAL